MADKDTTLQQLKDVVAAFETERDWRPYHTPKNLALGVAVETGELLEHFLWLTPEESCQIADDPAALAAVKDEIADVFCYLLNLVHVLGIDLSDAFRAKMKRNAEKYPAEQYRGKYKLDP